MSLGLLGEYGTGDSDSEISDSDDEANYPGKKTVTEKETSDKSISPHSGSTALDPSQDSSFEPEQGGLTGEKDPVSSSVGDPLSQGVGDSDGDSESSGEESESDSAPTPPSPVTLPLPDLDAIMAGRRGTSSGGANSLSVFSNPYREAEEAKLAVLKQHVALSENLQPTERGRRRGRGRQRQQSRTESFHPPPSSSEGASIQAMHTRSGVTMTGAGGPGDLLFDDSDSSVQRTEGKRKHRGGVTDSLMPTKKSMKLHQHLQAKERPWTVGNKRL